MDTLYQERGISQLESAIFDPDPNQFSQISRNPKKPGARFLGIDTVL